MSDPATLSYFGVPGYVFLWVITLICFSLFGWRVACYINVLRRARPDIRWNQIPKRVQLFFSNVLGQRRLLNEATIGVAHALIFWAFVFYASSFGWNLIRGLFPILPIPYAEEVLWMAFALEALGVLGLTALVVAAVRRYIFTPPRLERSFDASFILVLIAIVLLSFLGGEGFKVLAEECSPAWRPVGNLIAESLATLGVEATQASHLFVWAWWAHMITVLGFLAYLPYSKHMHLLVAPFGVLFASLQPGAVPPASEGASRLEEFTWRQLLNGLACAECGRCDRACPCFNSGYPLSPKMMIHEVKELVLGGLSIGNPVRASNSSNADAVGAESGKRFVGDAIKREEIWACATCANCMTVCPVFNEHIPLYVEMRRYLIGQGEVEELLQNALMKLARYGNSLGESDRKRAMWTQGLDFKPKDARRESVQWLWYVGDYASYHPALQETTRSLARVLHAAGLDYGILYMGEQNSGNDVRRVGEEGLFELLQEKNTATLQKAHFNNLFSTDPHTYNTLKNEYPYLNQGRHLVYHHTELLADLLERGGLKVVRRLPYRVTYHDPCYLGRYNGVYVAPRRVLDGLGVKLVEMPRNRANSYCCGAGGGRIWMEDVPGIKERPAESRVREAAALPGVEVLVVSCPKDFVMFQDAVKTTALEGKIVVKDLAELVEEGTRP